MPRLKLLADTAQCGHPREFVSGHDICPLGRDNEVGDLLTIVLPQSSLPDLIRIPNNGRGEGTACLKHP